MKTQMKKLSPKVKEWIYLSGYDENLIRYHMKNSFFAVEKVTDKETIESEGLDKNYPYVLFNPYNLKIKKTKN